MPDRGTTLVNGLPPAYCPHMLIRYWILAFVLGGLWPAYSEVIQLRDKATVSGKVLAEKKDQVFLFPRPTQAAEVALIYKALAHMEFPVRRGSLLLTLSSGHDEAESLSSV